MKKKALVILDAPGLGKAHLDDRELMPNASSLGAVSGMKPVFPAVTLPAQASLTTGAYPEAHGIVSNGLYFPERFKAAFWEQEASLVLSERVWDLIRRVNPDLKTAVLFFQNTLYARADAIVTPRPLHTDNGLVQWCYSKPPGLYEALSEKLGPFNLQSYWGPLASIESTRWIADAAIEVSRRTKPDLLFVYLPHLDYAMQRYGPSGERTRKAVGELDSEIGRMIEGIRNGRVDAEPVFILLSEYVFSDVDGAVPLNLILKEHGLLRTRTIAGREYLDIELSPAFAIVDHQAAHIHVKKGYREEVERIMRGTQGVDLVMGREAQDEFRVSHPRSGDLIAVSDSNKWFSYPWWTERAKEPDFAPRIDIHRKPGYDPLELFIEPGTMRIPDDPSLIKGSHGRFPAGDERPLPFISSNRLKTRPECITDMAKVIMEVLLGDAAATS